MWEVFGAWHHHDGHICLSLSLSFFLVALVTTWQRAVRVAAAASTVSASATTVRHSNGCSTYHQFQFAGLSGQVELSAGPGRTETLCTTTRDIFWPRPGNLKLHNKCQHSWWKRWFWLARVSLALSLVSLALSLNIVARRPRVSCRWAPHFWTVAVHATWNWRLSPPWLHAGHSEIRSFDPNLKMGNPISSRENWSHKTTVTMSVIVHGRHVTLIFP